MDRTYAAKKIFETYYNRRETVRRLSNQPKLRLTPKQEGHLVAVSRAHFRETESADSIRWLCRFFAETNLYFTSIVIKAWPSMRGKL